MQKTLLAISVAGMASLLSTPAFAQAIASGSSTIVLMNGASQSIGAELHLSSGVTFAGANGTGDIQVTPTLSAPLDTNTNQMLNLNVNPGLADTAISPNTPGIFSAVAASALDAATTLEAQVSIIRAGAGVDGLD